MLSTKGYFDGKNYILEDNITLKKNQRFIITFIEENKISNNNLKKYCGKINVDDSIEIEKGVNNSRKVDLCEW